MVLLLLFLIALPACCQALHNGVALTPAMGYNSWNDFRGSISEAGIKSVVQGFVKLNLASYGWKYINLDDVVFIGRQKNGTLIADPSTFPSGIPALAAYVHAAGLKFGIYTDRGNKTCAGRPGSNGYEQIDANFFASSGVDYLKEDSCFASPIHATAFAEYARMRDALNKTGRAIYFSLCGWHDWYAPVGGSLGNSWRIQGDVNTWDDVLRAMDTNAPLYKFAGPGQWNDPDMLLGSNPTSAVHLTPVQSRTQFSTWAIMAAPLLLGSNPSLFSSWDLETYTNSEVIAVSQDILGKQGLRIQGANLRGLFPSHTNIWARQLSVGWAAIFFNNGASSADIVCDAKCFSQMAGLSANKSVSVRDLWLHQNVGTATGSWTAKSVAGQGGSTVLLFQ